MHINERGRQITIWGTGKPEFKEEAMGGEPAENWDFVGEYLFVLDVDGEGKIVRILEFLDSLATARLQGLVARAMENLGKKKGVVG
ncbi:hypothetical protein BDW02DRAFT_572362 [Decorospora gaudefroyi]|uniref:Uncharacterized protein n=1 Tax=Decorospora gaudefroyi TaxID=184978 RepID=A0A6A5K8U0_9PLEO|nr:hypothetical protein BDW02DRAFT_572362 [Decorospora gaudefroyi]